MYIRVVYLRFVGILRIYKLLRDTKLETLNEYKKEKNEKKKKLKQIGC